MTPDLLGINPDGRYCVVPEDNILRSLVQSCWYVQARAGAWTWAMTQAVDTLERWLRLGLPHRREGGRRLFDPCVVCNFGLWASQNRGDPLFEQIGVPISRREVSELNPGTAARSGASEPTPFVVELRREFNLRGSPPRRLVRLRLPLPLEGHRCSLTAVRLIEPASADVAQTEIPGRVEIQLNGADRPERVVVAVQIRFRAWAESWAVDSDRLEEWDRTTPEYELYTRRAEGLIQVTASVVRLAESLAGSCRDAWQAVRAFWRFFFERMRPGYIHHDELDQSDPLGSLARRGWFDCYSGSALLAALCRARGIPARVVSGITLYLPRPSIHYWLEVLLPPYGWVPFDLYSWLLAAGKPDLGPWSTFYAGRLDQRMTAECLPRLTLGPSGVRFPPSWYQVAEFAQEGTEVAFHSLATQELLYRDQLRVRREAW